MSNIKKLSQEVITQIAAGEVIERPVSVLKELIENSIDAGASTLHIELSHGGLKKIEVTDDGSGMSRVDLLISFLPHTTSKLKSVDDLLNLSSFGFRGEALSSIASISRMLIQSRQKEDSIGFQAALESGKVIGQQPVGMAVGTRVVIDRLFEGIPVRKKFLKSAQTEWRHCMQYISKIALAYPEKNFVLTHNRERVLQLVAETTEQRISSMLGKMLSGNLMPIKFKTNYGKVTGFIGTPQKAQQNTLKQFLFVNKRPISDIHIAQTIKQAYANLIDIRSYPIFILHVDILPEFVDINIHPRKETARFLNQKNLLSDIYLQVESVLSQHNLTYQQGNKVWNIQDAGMDRYTAKFIREAESSWDVREVTIEDDVDIIQVHNCYLITETKQGILIIDQHAAHERILYEQFKNTFEFSREKKVQLTKPIVFNMSFEESILLEEHIKTLNVIGFEIDVFGDTSFRVLQVPAIYSSRNIVELITELIGDLASENAKRIDSVTERTLAFLACRSAIKAGDVLTLDQRRRLIKKLHQTKTHYTCPHGRPVQVQIPLAELDKMFKRR